MKLIKLIVETGFVISLLFSIPGCIPYYALGNCGADQIVFVKPVFKDSALITNYLGGRFVHSIDSAYIHKNEVNYYGQLNWSQTHTERYFNFSYGAFGYLGTYKVVEVENLNGNKFYYGGGLSSDFCLNIPLSNADLRLIGLKESLFYENGDFTKFRRIASEQNLIRGVTASQFAYNISITSGYEFKCNFGIDGSFGLTGFMNEKSSFFTSSLNAHYTYKRYLAYLQITESAWGLNDEYAIGVSYRLK